jgi:hypothetical protein
MVMDAAVADAARANDMPPSDAPFVLTSWWMASFVVTSVVALLVLTLIKLPRRHAHSRRVAKQVATLMERAQAQLYTASNIEDALHEERADLHNEYHDADNNSTTREGSSITRLTEAMKIIATGGKLTYSYDPPHDSVGHSDSGAHGGTSSHRVSCRFSLDDTS